MAAPAASVKRLLNLSSQPFRFSVFSLWPLALSLSPMASLSVQIQDEIRRDGPISFARFMELALYAPGLGYYEKQQAIGRRGDFFTSVSVGPLFGELLGFQFAQWLEEGAPSGPCQIIETGAHDGTLAGDILGWMQQWRPGLFARLEYCVVEPSPPRRQWQELTLRQWLPKIKWLAGVAETAPTPARRILFCNELLDAMPTHRLAWNAAVKKWEECRVACANGRFVWQSPPLPEWTGDAPVMTPELAAVLPPGFVVEHCPAAAAWWKKAAASLSSGGGKLLTLDYGLTGGERFMPERTRGTLRTFSRHHAGSDLLDDPGGCDITAHVDFSALEAAGRAAGLTTETMVSQEQFLTRILAQTETGGFAAWTGARTRQFQTLTHPSHLGRAFRVLIQSKKAEG
jgi:SAM-dependent MidA family methyltransferase